MLTLCSLEFYQYNIYTSVIVYMLEFIKVKLFCCLAQQLIVFVLLMLELIDKCIYRSWAICYGLVLTMELP